LVTGIGEEAMRRAIELAASTHPHPNPRVGAVIMADGEIVGTGWHERPGEPHAEVMALLEAGERAAGATAVVTLEPCDHHGRTGPCAAALVAAGVSEVVVGTIDPDPLVSGRGVAALRRAGITVTVGVLGQECEGLDPAYFHHRRTGRPLVTLKLAATLDGQIAARDGTSKWITSEEARTDAHRLRAAADVVMVGAGTIRKDDPALDVRLPGYTGPQPRPVVIAGAKPLPADARIWGRQALTYAPRPIAVPGEHVVVPGDADRVDLAAVMEDLAARGHLAVMVEGGAGLARSLLAGRHIDRFIGYLGGMIAGGSGTGMFSGGFPTMAAATPIAVTRVEQIGPDVRIEAMMRPDD
jgi:diaminohydroxyphosphoribosylaminopyrimidine deaminase/5-amino-6-(5-phosphoribosylamino)uracil reductase